MECIHSGAVTGAPDLSPTGPWAVQAAAPRCIRPTLLSPITPAWGLSWQESGGLLLLFLTVLLTVSQLFPFVNGWRRKFSRHIPPPVREASLTARDFVAISRTWTRAFSTTSSTRGGAIKTGCRPCWRDKNRRRNGQTVPAAVGIWMVIPTSVPACRR